MILASLDTKAAIAQYSKACIENAGAPPIVINIGYGRRASIAAGIDADALAQAGGSDWAGLLAADALNSPSSGQTLAHELHELIAPAKTPTAIERLE